MGEPSRPSESGLDHITASASAEQCVYHLSSRRERFQQYRAGAHLDGLGSDQRCAAHYAHRSWIVGWQRLLFRHPHPHHGEWIGVAAIPHQSRQYPCGRNSKPASPGEFLNLPTSAPSGVITVQWAPTDTTGPSGLFSYIIRQFVDGSPVPVNIVETSTPSFTFGSGQTAGVSVFSHMVAAHGEGRIAPRTTSSPLEFLNGETGGAALRATSTVIK